MHSYKSFYKDNDFNQQPSFFVFLIDPASASLRIRECFWRFKVPLSCYVVRLSCVIFILTIHLNKKENRALMHEFLVHSIG